MKPWAIYTRVSTDKQAQRGASLDAQLAACTALATAHGYQTIHIADAGESAGEVNQPGVGKLRALAAEGKIAGVLVYKLDRIARNTRGLLDLVEAFTAAGVHFSSVQERIDTSGASGRLILTVLAALAQFEREQLIERITATNVYRRGQGAWVGGAPPVGLAVEKRDKLRHLVKHPEHGDAVAQSWTMVLDGLSLAEIAAHLQASGVPTSMAKRKTTGVWAKNAVSYLLANRSYIGLLVTADDFERVHGLLGMRSSPKNRAPAQKPMPRPSERTWRLHGLARCARCGSALVGTSARGSRGVVYYYLRCTGRVHRGTGFCSSKDLPAEPWEDAIVERLSAYLSDPKALQGEIARQVAQRLAEAGPMREEAQTVERERDGLAEQLSRALEIGLQGGATARAVGPKIGELRTKIEAMEVEIGRLQGHLAATDIDAQGLEAIAGILAGSATHLIERDWARQRAVLELLVIEVTVASGKPGVIRIRLPSSAQQSRSEVPGSWRVRTEGRMWLTPSDRLRTGTVDLPLVCRESFSRFPRRLVLTVVA